MSATIASASGIAVATIVRNTIEQHDERGEQAEELLRALLDRRELGVAVELDDHADRLDCLADGLLHGDDLLAILLVDHAVELRLRVRDPAVLGERLVGEGIAHARDARGAVRVGPGRREVLSLEGLNCLFDRGAALGRVELLALGRREHEVQHAALLRGELRLDQVGRLLRVRARDLELVLEASPDRPDEQDERGDDPDPGDHHAPRVACAGSHPARERACRQSFVCCETCLVLGHAQTPHWSLRVRPVSASSLIGRREATWLLNGVLPLV